MDKLIYTAMTGASHVMKQQATVSENLANVNTPGFREVMNSFRAIPMYGDGLATREFVVDSTVGANFQAGVLQETGRELDVAIPGQGWLVVEDAEREEALTRNGSLEVSNTGLLQTRQGHLVMSDNGPLTIPPDTNISIARDGTISAVPRGGDAAQVVTLGRLKLVNPPPENLDRSGDGLFRTKDGERTIGDPMVQIKQHALETSNVNTAETLVNMISLARKFDMQMKLLERADNNAQQATQIIRA